MLRRNLILKTDSYKLTHHDMLPDGTARVYSYLEARNGGDYDRTVWFGLQYYLQEYLAGSVVSHDDIEEARALCGWHFGGNWMKFDVAGWQYIVNQYGGRLPLRICAPLEGSIIPTGNVLMTIENTDPRVPWLTNAVESLLMKVWYPMTVATRSWYVRQGIFDAVERTGGDVKMVDYMLHDFGYRGASSEESAAIGGAAHLLSFSGTDTIEAMRFARDYYGANQPGASVAATEHSIMTALGPHGERAQALRVIAHHPNQIVSVVADSYDYYRFVDWMIAERELIDRNHVRLVIRPDSVTRDHRTPADVILWTLERIAAKLGSIPTSTGHKILPYGVLWGDGLEPTDITLILDRCTEAGFAAQNLVFGMGGGLLQKVNRDTCRCAIKCSAQLRNGEWSDVQKTPHQIDKASKAGRLQLVHGHAGYETIRENEPTLQDHLLQPVFEDGLVLRQERFETIRQSVRGMRVTMQADHVATVR